MFLFDEIPCKIQLKIQIFHEFQTSRIGKKLINQCFDFRNQQLKCMSKPKTHHVQQFLNDDNIKGFQGFYENLCKTKSDIINIERFVRKENFHQ